MSSTPVPPALCGLFLLGQATNASDENPWIWLVVPFFALVAVFVLYQQRQSGWTWREFAEGMLALLKRLGLGFIGLAAHVHLPPDDD